MRTDTCCVYRSVGVSTAAFVAAMLEGSTQPGVWFPEEVFLSRFPKRPSFLKIFDL